jgi:hypothetical protein
MGRRGPARAAPGDYGSRRAERNAERRSIQRTAETGVEIVHAADLVKPEPDQDWPYVAKLIWTMASTDPATSRWSEGDWLQLYLLADYAGRVYSTPGKRIMADNMRVLLDGLKGLMLDDVSKRSAGLFVDRSDPAADPFSAELAEIMALADGDE